MFCCLEFPSKQKCWCILVERSWIYNITILHWCLLGPVVGDQQIRWRGHGLQLTLHPQVSFWTLCVHGRIPFRILLQCVPQGRTDQNHQTLASSLFSVQYYLNLQIHSSIYTKDFVSSLKNTSNSTVPPFHQAKNSRHLLVVHMETMCPRVFSIILTAMILTSYQTT